MGFASKSYYEILDIDPAATAEEVRKSYSTVKATWDPGAIATYSLYSPAESELISRKIEEAFQILTDPERRRRYDRYCRFMEHAHSHVDSAEAFWRAVEEPARQNEAGLDRITELLTAGAVVERDVDPSPSPVVSRIASRPEVEREWRDVVDGGSSTPSTDPDRGPEPSADADDSGLPTASLGRAAAAMAPPSRPPPVRKTWVSPTVGAATIGAGWRRPDRSRPPTPRALDEIEIGDEVVAHLEELHGLGGAFLGSVREAKGISIESVADHTKIGCTYLKDIEREDFDSLPPPVYLRGFVLQYVRLLRLDVDRVVAAYMARYDADRARSSSPL